jgi:hypothetical protein
MNGLVFQPTKRGAKLIGPRNNYNFCCLSSRFIKLLIVKTCLILRVLAICLLAALPILRMDERRCPPKIMNYLQITMFCNNDLVMGVKFHDAHLQILREGILDDYFRSRQIIRFLTKFRVKWAQFIINF